MARQDSLSGPRYSQNLKIVENNCGPLSHLSQPAARGKFFPVKVTLE
jgi:hypothetical protein